MLQNPDVLEAFVVRAPIHPPLHLSICNLSSICLIYLFIWLCVFVCVCVSRQHDSSIMLYNIIIIVIESVCAAFRVKSSSSPAPLSLLCCFAGFVNTTTCFCWTRHTHTVYVCVGVCVSLSESFEYRCSQWSWRLLQVDSKPDDFSPTFKSLIGRCSTQAALSPACVWFASTRGQICLCVAHGAE